jgi:gamma-glutamyltranspeptidase/glutathione hydrolase
MHLFATFGLSAAVLVLPSPGVAQQGNPPTARSIAQPSPAPSAEASPTTGSPPARGAPSKPLHAAIASAHPLASDAGRRILLQGGNAFDAAVAVAAALAVVEPSSSGLGGGGFFLLHRASDGFETFIDAREVAPAAASADMFLDAKGNPVAGLSTSSALAAAIPGEPAAFEYVARHQGRLCRSSLRPCLQPAIRLARQGFAVYPRLRAGLEGKQTALLKSPDAARIFLVKGQVPALGTVIKQPELARTLETLADEGAQGFYSGALSRQLAAGVRRLGGIWTADDLARYAVKEREPLRGEYRGARIVSAPPPSSGGVALIDALNILSGYPLDAVDSVTRKHLIIEAMQRVHRDRADYLGDPDFVAVPVERLISPNYAAGQRTAIRMDRALPSEALAGVVESAEAGPQTTHFSILDAEGNRAAVTISLNFFFGSGLMVPGTGVLLNNQMDDFSAKPGVPNGFQLVGNAANAIAPGKRMLSSMAPTFVEKDDGLLIIGSPGGNFIIGMVLLGTLEWMDGRSAEQIVALPRYHHQYLPDVVMHEANAFTAQERAELIARGHKLKELPRPFGNMQVVTWDYRSGKVEAASDPRGAGEGLVY